MVEMATQVISGGGITLLFDGEEHEALNWMNW